MEFFCASDTKRTTFADEFAYGPRQTLNILKTQGNGSIPDGDGFPEALAFPNIYQLFGDKASAAVQTIQSSLGSWAISQAGSGMSATALNTIFQIQADLMVKRNGEFHRLDLTLDAHHEIYSESSVPVAEMLFNIVPPEYVEPYTRHTSEAESHPATLS